MPDETRIEKKMLTALSMNGRMHPKTMSKLLGISSQKAYRRARALEKKYGIRYVPEIDVESLGYLKFLVLVKFTHDVPQGEDVKKVLEAEPRIQYGAVLKGGDYDLLLYVLSESNADIQVISSRLRRNTVLINYPAKWYITPFYEHYGFVPLRNEFVDSLKERVMKKAGMNVSRQSKEKRQQIMQREFAILRELNEDGSTDLLEIDKKYGFDTGRAQYAYYKLIESNILKRVTISMHNMSIKYLVAIFVEITDQKAYYETRVRLLKDIMYNPESPTNRYILIGDIATPFGVIFLLPVYEEQDLDGALGMLSTAKGTSIKTAIIMTSLVGTLCFRRFDNAYSKQAYVLNSQYEAKLPNRIDYQEKRGRYRTSTEPVLIDFGDLK